MAKRAAKKATKRAGPGGNNDAKAMELIQRSGILNKNVTLEQITELSKSLVSSGFGSAGIAWCFLSPWYIYYGDFNKKAMVSTKPT